jgi:hypothetical protein
MTEKSEYGCQVFATLNIIVGNYDTVIWHVHPLCYLSASLSFLFANNSSGYCDHRSNRRVRQLFGTSKI